MHIKYLEGKKEKNHVKHNDLKEADLGFTCSS